MPPPPLDRGQRAPDFVLPSALSGVRTRFYGFAGGRITLLVFTGNEAPRLPIVDAELIVIHRTTAHELDAKLVFVDGDLAVSRAYGVPPDAEVIFVLDPNLRILERIEDGREPRPPHVETVPAPVLMIPNVMDAEQCRDLIATFERDGGVETGVEASRDGARESILDAYAKRRRDLTVADPELIKILTTHLGRRVIPELEKAFAFGSRYFEGFKIARYDAASGGHFRAHRDNLSPATARRKFAMTLNLNEGYEGGHLRFPEYGPNLYRPATGGAIVFSSSLLHEATTVTAGSRFVLLTFFLDAARGLQE